MTKNELPAWAEKWNSGNPEDRKNIYAYMDALLAKARAEWNRDWRNFLNKYGKAPEYGENGQQEK